MGRAGRGVLLDMVFGIARLMKVVVIWFKAYLTEGVAKGDVQMKWK